MSSLALNKSSNTNETESNDIISSHSFWDNLYSMDSNYLSFTDMVSDNNNFIIPMQNGDSEEFRGCKIVLELADPMRFHGYHERSVL